MAWSTTEPTLPNGSSWEEKGTTSWANNHIQIVSTVSVARLDGDQIAVRITETRTQHGTYWQKDNYLRVDIGGVTGTAYTTAWAASAGVAASIYYTGTAAAGDTVNVIVGFREDTSSTLKSVSFTAPALLGPTVYINVGGTWKQASAVYVKSSGAWKEGQLKINVGGAWK